MKNNHKRIMLIAFLLTLSLGVFLACNSTTNKSYKVASEDKVISKDKKAESTIPVKDTATKSKQANQIPLKLTIKNLESHTAQVVVTFYNSECTFLDPPHALKRYRFTPAGNTLTAKIDDLKYGEYAFVTFQDMNGNGKFDKNLLGIPREPYAFSNNFKPTVRAPELCNCSFVYSKSINKMVVTMMSR